MDRRATGILGEELAAQALRSKGYTILQRNYRGNRGEVDIVARDGATTVFVEVKTWAHLPTIELGRAIDVKKQARIAAAATHYLAMNAESTDGPIRFDVVLVRPTTGSMEHIAGAFEVSGEWFG